MQNKPNIADVAAAVPRITFHEEIGEGGFKVVYRCDVNGTEEAVKIVRIPVDPSDAVVEETNRKRLQRELDLLEICQSASLVKLGQLTPVDFQIGGDQYVCYSEELIPGDNLSVFSRVVTCPSPNSPHWGYRLWQLSQSYLNTTRFIETSNH